MDDLRSEDAPTAARAVPANPALAPVEPAALVGVGRADPALLLIAWYLRQASFLLVSLGVLIALLVDPDSVGDTVVDGTKVQLADELQSPLAGVAVGVIAYAAASACWYVLSLLLAWRSRWVSELAMPGRTRLARVWIDRFRVASSYSALRRTAPVRYAAADRIPGGRVVMRVTNDGIACAHVVLGIAIVAALLLR